MKNSKIVKIKKNKQGKITDVLLENGQVLPLNHAIMMAREHIIEGVGVVKGGDGGEYLVADPNVMDVDNLKDLPRF
ncbi:DUF3892 domain-containing protein [Clostridium sp. WILCCON 0269]|uniref:DUF3892 domain-containing protein n=1 Tax=Candidatus Clostridium eludens TaxID=3381663 RepID=A0ABW8SMM6_9CLOT